MKLNFTHSLVVFLALTFQSVFSQESVENKITASGQIVAAEKSDGISKGDPLVGVTISIKGTTRGTVTDVDGNFKLENVLVGSKLVVSYIGFAPEEITVTEGKTDYNIPLKLDTKQLEEVVFVGYGTQKKRDVTGATVSVSEKDMRLTLNTGLDQALQGRAAGVTVTQVSGQPGASANVNIRGIGSVNGSQPLYVIDGVPIDLGITDPNNSTNTNLNSINPNDIETMEILKDASAAAIYGARGANGVVLITTKRGKSGKGVIEYNGQVGLDNTWKRLDVLNADQYRGFYSSIYKPAQALIYTDPDTIAQQANTNWQDKVFQQGIIQDHSLSARGGNDFATYSIGLGYYKQTGIVKRNDFERFTFRVNSDIKPKKWLTIGESFSFSRTTQSFGSDANGLLNDATKTSPTIAVFARPEDTQNIGGYGGQITTLTGYNDGINVVANNNSLSVTNINNRVLGNVYIEAEIFKGLKYRLNTGADLNFRDNTDIGQPYFYGQLEGRNRPSKTISYNRDLALNWLADNILSYAKKVGRHDFSALAGYSSQYFFNSGFSASGSTYPTQINTIGASLSPNSFNAGGANTEAALIGYIGRVTYVYNDLLMFTANARYDGSSRFGKNYKYGFFPSFSAGWRISNMEFMKNYQWISDLKLRAGYGVTGNQDLANIPNGNYLFTQVIYPDIIRYPLGPDSKIFSAAAPTLGLANPNLRWESVTQANIGLDVALFQNSITMNVDAFLKQSSGILIPVSINALSGVQNAPFFTNPSYFKNAGDVRNMGIEASITYRNEKNAFKFSISPNFTLVENKVIKLEGEAAAGSSVNIPNADGRIRTQAGHPIGSFYGYVTDGIIQNSTDSANYAGNKLPSGNTTKSSPAGVGDIRFKDLNNDGVIGEKDRTFIGKPNPTISYGLTLRASYKWFDFSLFLQGAAGMQIYNNQRADLEAMKGGNDWNQLTSVLNHWTPTNTNTDIPRAVLGDPSLNTRYSDRWIENGDYVRIKSVQVGLSIPETILKSLFRTQDPVSLRFYIGSQNLRTWTAYKGFDPEISNLNPTNTGIDYGNFPQARRFLGGLQFSF